MPDWLHDEHSMSCRSFLHTEEKDDGIGDDNDAGGGIGIIFSCD